MPGLRRLYVTKISGRTRLTTNFNLPSFYFRSSDYCRFYKFRNGGNILAAKLFFLLPASRQHCSSITPGNIDGADTTHKQYGTLSKAPQHNTGRPLLTITYKHVPLSAATNHLLRLGLSSNQQSHVASVGRREWRTWY